MCVGLCRGDAVLCVGLCRGDAVLCVGLCRGDAVGLCRGDAVLCRRRLGMFVEGAAPLQVGRADAAGRWLRDCSRRAHSVRQRAERASPVAAPPLRLQVGAPVTVTLSRYLALAAAALLLSLLVGHSSWHEMHF